MIVRYPRESGRPANRSLRLALRVRSRRAIEWVVETLAVYRGELPRRALALVLEWAEAHRDELRHDWQRAQEGEVLAPIEPLD